MTIPEGEHDRAKRNGFRPMILKPNTMITMNQIKNETNIEDIAVMLWPSKPEPKTPEPPRLQSRRDFIGDADDGGPDF